MTATPDLYVVVIKDKDGTLEYEADARDPLTALRSVIRQAVKEGWHAKALLNFSVSVTAVHRESAPNRKWWKP